MEKEKLDDKMKAVRMHSRSGPENLFYEETNIPQLLDGEVLIEVHAASITPTELTWNSSYTTKDGQDRIPSIPSYEISGVVDKVSEKVHHLKQGDEVYGLLDFWRNGGAAQYVAIDAENIALKPVTVDHISAASLPLSGLTAWQALFDHGNLQRGQSVIIHGASGGVGSLAVQLAHWRGAHVIGTCSRSKHQLVSQLGADEIIDYKTQKFEEVAKKVDVVLDTVGGETLSRSYQTVKRGGVLVTVADDADGALAMERGIKAVSFLVRPDRNQLREIAMLVDSGKLRPVIQETFPLMNARQAFQSGINNHNTGKIVLEVKQGKQ